MGLVVDLFAGGGGASTGIEAALGRPVDIAINHDPVAMAVHRRNHPRTRHFEADVWEVRPSEVTQGKPVDLLWLSPDCFAAGTLVMTKNGLASIESIREGTMVLTHKGRWRRVTGTVVKESETIELRGHGHFGLLTTPNHPFYSKHITKRYPGRLKPDGKRPSMVRELVENPYWPRAESMAGKLWATPRRYPEASIPTCEGAEFSDAFFYFVGRWLGDGSINKGDVEICCGKVEAPRFEEWVLANQLRRASGEIVPYRTVDHDSSLLFVWANAPLMRWLSEQFGVGCENKALPPWCLAMQQNWRRALLKGYVDADGYALENPSELISTTSVSKSLSIGIRLLAVSLGNAACLYRTVGGPGEIEGRKFVALDSYKVNWRAKIQRETVFWDGSHCFSPVREVLQTGRRERVYCLSVEEDESFVADGIVVHNCKHFSNAKGDVPRDQDIRSLAWVGIRWAKLPADVRPRIISLENVREFEGWGPLGEDGRPDKKRRGQTFKRWCSTLRNLGYAIDWRVLDASLYGAPTRRKRLFLIARSDGLPICWPEPTHGPGLVPLHTAAECIDWSIPCPSIFERRHPLKPKTLWRIAQGMRRFVFENPEPFIIHVAHGGRVAAFIHRFYGGPRPSTGSHPSSPLPTITAWDHNSIVTVDLDPVGARGLHVEEVRAFLTAYFGNDGTGGQQLLEPMRTLTTKHRRGIVTVAGRDIQVSDIGFRMLGDAELLRAQFGRFAKDYDLSPAETIADKVWCIGNSVCPEMAEALIRANMPSERRAGAACSNQSHAVVSVDSSVCLTRWHKRSGSRLRGRWSDKIERATQSDDKDYDR